LHRNWGPLLHRIASDPSVNAPIGWVVEESLILWLRSKSGKYDLDPYPAEPLTGSTRGGYEGPGGRFESGRDFFTVKLRGEWVDVMHRAYRETKFEIQMIVQFALIAAYRKKFPRLNIPEMPFDPDTKTDW
jgi:hypothetical protein